jgi:hypothetical protein
MLLLEEYISNFTCASYTFLYGEFSDFYVNQFLAGQTIPNARVHQPGRVMIDPNNSN